MRGRRPLTLTWLAVMLASLAVLAGGVGVWLVLATEPDDAGREAGKWLLQVSLVFVGTGVVSVVVRQAELSRARRDAWAEALHELIRAHDDAQMASRLLSAHATAMTYAEQIKVLTTCRGILRRLASAPGMRDDEPLHQALLQMRAYLKKIIQEYQTKYLPVARQQRLDEAVLNHRIEQVAEASDGAFPLLPAHLAKPLPAGLALQDAGTFPKLNEFVTAFKKSEFRTAYELAKPIMQRKAGLPIAATDGQWTSGP